MLRLRLQQPARGERYCRILTVGIYVVVDGRQKKNKGSWGPVMRGRAVGLEPKVRTSLPFAFDQGFRGVPLFFDTVLGDDHGWDTSRPIEPADIRQNPK